MLTLTHQRFALGLAAVIASILFLANHGSVGAHGTHVNLYFPASAGTQWSVIQGYNAGTHQDQVFAGSKYSLDFTRVGGTTGGTQVLMPIDGQFIYYDPNSTAGCFGFGTPAGTLQLCHIKRSVWPASGETIRLGTPIGTISRSGETGYNNTEHIHVQLYTVSNGQRVAVPFTDPVFLDGWDFGCTSCENWPRGWNGMVSHNPGVATPPPPPSGNSVPRFCEHNSAGGYGRCLDFAAGTYDMTDYGFNDRLTTIIIPSGSRWKVTVYEHVVPATNWCYGSGWIFTSGGGRWEINLYEGGLNFNDKASCVKVERL